MTGSAEDYDFPPGKCWGPTFTTGGFRTLGEYLAKQLALSVETPEPWSPNKALVVVYKGRGTVLTHQVCHAFEDQMSDDDMQFEATPDGVWVMDVGMEAVGVSDWPGGGHEYSIAIGGESQDEATDEEWNLFCDGDWPWAQEPPESNRP